MRLSLLPATALMFAAVAASGQVAADPAVPLAPAPTPAPTSAIVGGAVEGEFVFEKCATCHLPSGSSSTGPDLNGVVGRRAAQLADFVYSKAMQDAGVGNLVWDDASLDHFLTDPHAAVPGTSMNGKPLPSAQDRADVIAYLKTLTRS